MSSLNNSSTMPIFDIQNILGSSSPTTQTYNKSNQNFNNNIKNTSYYHNQMYHKTHLYKDWLRSFPGIQDYQAQETAFLTCMKNTVIPFQNSLDGQNRSFNKLPGLIKTQNTSSYQGILSNSALNWGGLMCPPTFDGYGCWDKTMAGTRQYIQCPSFVLGFDSQRKAFKDCLENGTWFRHPITQRIWSNYTTCIDLGDFELRRKVVNLYIIGYAISLIAVLLAIIIFSHYKSLHCTRTQIHNQLFYSFVGNNLSRIIWHALLMDGNIVLNNHIACQIIHIIAQYFMTCNYMWMFCEGLYLHTVITMALRNIKYMVAYLCSVGWGFPILLVSAYATMRYQYNQILSCWSEKTDFKWILDGPIIASMIVSFMFMCNIIRILVAKLTSFNSAETHQTSKAVKGTLILLPLLGMHFIILPTRPPKGSHYEALYEYISVILVTSQGLFVTAIFCFLNSDVQTCIKNSIKTHAGCFNSNPRLFRNKQKTAHKTNGNGAKYSQITMKTPIKIKTSYE